MLLSFLFLIFNYLIVEKPWEVGEMGLHSVLCSSGTKQRLRLTFCWLFNSQHCHLLPWGNKQSVDTFVLDEKTKGWWIGSPQIKEGAQKWLAQDEVLAKEIEWWVKAPRPLIKLVYSQQLVFCFWLLESHYPSWFKRKPRTLHLFIQTMCNYKQNCTKLFLWSPGIHVLPLYISQKWMCSLFFIALWDLATDLLVVWLNLYFQPANARKFKTSSSFYC